MIFKTLTNNRPINFNEGDKFRRLIQNYFKEQYANKIINKINKLSNGIIRYRKDLYFVQSVKLDYEYYRNNGLSKVHKNNKIMYDLNRAYNGVFSERKHRYRDKILFNIQFQLFNLRTKSKDLYIVDIERFLKDKDGMKYVCSINIIDEICKLNNIEIDKDTAYCYNLLNYLSVEQESSSIDIDVNKRLAPCLIINNRLYIGDNEDEDLMTHSRLLNWISEYETELNIGLEEEYDYCRRPDCMEDEEDIESFAFGHLIKDEHDNEVIVWELDTMSMNERDFMSILNHRDDYIHVCTDETYNINSLFKYNNRENKVLSGRLINEDNRSINLSMYGVHQIELSWLSIIRKLNNNRLLKENKKIYKRELLYKRKKDLRY